MLIKRLGYEFTLVEGYGVGWESIGRIVEKLNNKFQNTK